MAIVLVASTACAPPADTSSPLEGTSWQLVKFQGGDDTTLTPDDRAKYTVAFGAGGQVVARIDCNGDAAPGSRPDPVSFSWNRWH